MERKEIKKNAIAHYEKMIKWAQEQNKNKLVNPTDMYLCINESWFSLDCSYCQNFNFIFCRGCPLLNGECCGGLWEDMNHSATWLTWGKRAMKVLEYIKKNG